MLVPRRVKHRREFRGEMRGEVKGGKTIAFGEYGLEAVEPRWITNRQTEIARIAMTRFVKRGGRVWTGIFPQKPYTARGVGVHMDFGRDAPAGRVAVVKKGKIMFEIDGVSEDAARRALRLASDKFLIKTKFIRKSSGVGGESNEG